MIRAFQGLQPRIDASAFVAETAGVIGDVEVGQKLLKPYSLLNAGEATAGCGAI